MREWLRRAVEWLGFTPTQREAHLGSQLRQETAAVRDYRDAFLRVEQLLLYRERLGATTIDTTSVRGALYGEPKRW